MFINLHWHVCKLPFTNLYKQLLTNVYKLILTSVYTLTLASLKMNINISL